jgi:hypothetical protein
MFCSEFNYFFNLYRAICVGWLKPVDTNNDFWYRLAIADTKKTSFFVSFKWYRSGGPIPKMAY